MNELVVTVKVDGADTASITATRTHFGTDGFDTYAWHWGIWSDRGYDQINEGISQHRDIDGAFSLLAKILATTGVKPHVK